MDRSLVTAALLLVLVQVAYSAYYAAGITAVLWDDGAGFYFSENDVLHVGIILWLGYLVAVVGPLLRDASTGGVRVDG
jgi:membrane-bound ClpP family serine protease